jgi:hypothetical protein
MATIQPCIEVGVSGGVRPGRGMMMLDTGAAFSLMSSAVARRFGLRVDPNPATFTVANGTTAKIVGTVDLSLQLHNEMALRLGHIKVQEMDGEWLFLLGADILRGAKSYFHPVGVFTGSHVLWRMCSGVQYHLPLDNQVGPANVGDNAVASVAPITEATRRPPAAAAAPAEVLPGPPVRPPPPPPTGSKRDAAKKAAGTERESTEGVPTSLMAMQSRYLTDQDKRDLLKFAAEREAFYDASFADFQRLRDDLKTRCDAWCIEHRLPRPLRIALGRCLFRRWSPGFLERVMAHCCEAHEAGRDAFRGAVRQHGIPE